MYIRIEYYSYYTESLTECVPYNSAGQYIPGAFYSYFLASSGSGIFVNPGFQSKYVTQVFYFTSDAVAAQATTVHFYLYNYYGLTLDYY